MSSDSAPLRIIKQAALSHELRRIGSEAADADPQDQQRLEVERQAQREACEQTCRERLRDTEAQIEAMLAEARTQSAQLLNEAQQKIVQITQQAEQQGLEQGRASGQAETRRALQQAQQILQAAQADRERLLQASEGEMVQLVLQIVRKILRIEPIINEQVLIKVVRAALERLGKQVNVVIRVHPEDLELLHFSLLQLEDLALEIELMPDPAIEPGGCRVVSAAGEIDATLQTQFEAVARSFLQLASEPPDPLQ
ncbi:MAG: hypothetical protein IGS03_10930 [Candidatus Sericytochromatia bacterium]|nr:hypothetical protein [Candidatus Sericytochromatia bacterium]